MKRIHYNEETFKNKVSELYNSEVQIIGHFKSLDKPILSQDKFGIMQCTAASLLVSKPGIKAALNKTQYFMNMLKDSYPEIAELLEPLSEYKAMKQKMLFKTKFGIVSIFPDALIHGHTPSIRSAVNRKEYFENLLLFIYGDLYKFKIISTDRHKGKVGIICPIHGLQYVDSDSIFLGTGCPKCNREVAEPNLLYLVRLYTEEESFYKLGVSHKLKNGNISMFKSYEALGYNVEILKIITFKDSLNCREFELKLKRLIRNNLYVPKKWDYAKSTEAFQENILTKVTEQINNVEYDIVSTSMETLSRITELELTTPIEDT